MTPRISDKALHRLTIPELSGGVNYRDGISLVLDNQLTDCKNVWYKDGMLRTRPGLSCSEKESNLPISNKKAKVYTNPKNIRIIDGIVYQLVVFQYPYKIVLRYYADENTYKEIATIDNSIAPDGYGGVGQGLPPNEDYTLNVFQHNTDIYIFTSGYDETNLVAPFFIYKVTEKDGTFNAVRIGPDDVYAPLVMTGYTSTGKIYQSDEDIRKSATLYEGYNLLGNRYKFTGSLITEDYVNPEEENPNNMNARCMPMYYKFPKSLKGLKGTVEVTITLPKGIWKPDAAGYDNGQRGNSGTFVHIVDFSGRGTAGELGENPLKDGIRLWVDEEKFWFTDITTATEAKNETVAKIDTDNFMLENLEVEAPCENSEENYKKVLNMTFSEWYGADSKGLYGGMHLFMGGNSSEKNLVIWSDFNRPLYFGENCYAYVGDKSQNVTAFGRQGEALIIFKEKEIYATQYVSNDSVISAESVINGSVIDVTAAEVCFPMVQVHGYIGCDCPNTIQMCRNRLVWLSSNGRAYTLSSANQYNERSVFEVSGMVTQKLKNHAVSSLKKALSVDWQGKYILKIEDIFYLMDYDSYGFANISSYAKSEDAQARIPWWIWDFEGLDIDSLLILEDRLFMIVCATQKDSKSSYLHRLICLDNQNGIDNVPYLNEKDEEYIEERKISAIVQTKLFDFGAATIQKSVPKAEISFGNNEGLPIMVTTITDKGENGREVALNFDDANNRSPQFFKNTVIRNQERHMNRIGYKFESEGNLFVDALSVYYKQLGGSK